MAEAHSESEWALLKMIVKRHPTWQAAKFAEEYKNGVPKPGKFERFHPNQSAWQECINSVRPDSDGMVQRDVIDLPATRRK